MALSMTMNLFFCTTSLYRKTSTFRKIRTRLLKIYTLSYSFKLASIPDNNLTKDEQQALKRLKNDNDIVILPADKGLVTVVMDKTDYFDKMDAETYEELKRDTTPALQRKLNSKILTRKELLFVTVVSTTRAEVIFKIK